MNSKQLREAQAAAAAQLVKIPQGQELTFECVSCGNTEFELQSKFKMVFDRLAPREHGLVPQTPELVCSCGRRILLDPGGDAIMLRDMKLQIRKLSPSEPQKT